MPHATTKHRNTKIKARVSQEGTLSPTIFNIYMSDILLSKNNSIDLITYAYKITPLTPAPTQPSKTFSIESAVERDSTTVSPTFLQ